MNFKDFIKLLNLRDDLRQGKIKSGEALKKIPNQEFKHMFWACADLFLQLKTEAERRGIWEEITRKRDD